MRISVVVPSYHRPDALVHCLEALSRQQRAPDEIIVVIRDDDDESATLLARHAAVIAHEVTQPGAVHAMASGAAISTGDVIAFTDDDARPHPEWLARLEATFGDDPRIAAAGGRDVIFDGDVQRVMTLSQDVGRLTWFGRLIGNHHRGTGGPRDVVVLKGVNSAYRRDALELPDTFRGAGTQIHFEVAMGIRITQTGRRLIYDPAILVDHFPATRQDADQRGSPPASAVAGHAYNLTTSIALLGWRRLAVRYLYGVIVGDAAMPGVLRAARGVLQGDHGTGTRLRGALEGNTAALIDWCRGRRPTFVTPPPLP